MKKKSIQQSCKRLYDLALQGVPHVHIDSIKELAEDYLTGEAQLEQKVNSLVRWQVTKAGTSGFLAGLGGILTLPVTLPCNFTTVLFVQIRMVAAIAYMAGHDPCSDRVKTMVYVCVVGHRMTDILKSTGTLAAQNALVAKFGIKGVIDLGKAVPWVGGAVGGCIDGTATYMVGQVARQVFVDGEPSGEVTGGGSGR